MISSMNLETRKQKMEEWSNDTTKKAEKKENKGKKEMRYKVVLRAFCPCQRLPLFLNQERKKTR